MDSLLLNSMSFIQYYLVLHIVRTLNSSYVDCAKKKL